MSPRIVYTGAAGMLGREIGRVAAERGIAAVGWSRETCDLTDADLVARSFVAGEPEVVIHAAAWTDVDGCESDPARAFLENGRATANVAAACRATGARLITVSTDYVFSGDAPTPYRETDRPGPLSVYGWSKLMAEEATLALGERGAVARTAWVYAEHGRNFLLTMLRLAAERERLGVVDDQHGTPTYAGDLATALLELAAGEPSGIYHVTNDGATTWNGFARAIFEETGNSTAVDAVTSDAFPRPARRPANSVLARTRSDGPRLAPWREALVRCLARRASAEAA